MKKTIKSLTLSLLIGGVLASGAYARDGFSFAGLWKNDTLRAGGAIELGFPNIYEKEKNGSVFYIRDALEIGGAGLMTQEIPAGITMINDKVIFGGKISQNGITMKSYGFAFAGADLFFPESIKFSSKKMSAGFDFGGGGGFELGFEKSKSAFVVEYGGGCMIRSKEMNGYNNISLGFRQYF